MDEVKKEELEQNNEKAYKKGSKVHGVLMVALNVILYFMISVVSAVLVVFVFVKNYYYTNGATNATTLTEVASNSSKKINESFDSKYEKITMTEINDNFIGTDTLPVNVRDGYKVIMVKFDIERKLSIGDYDYKSFNCYADGVAMKPYSYDDVDYPVIDTRLGAKTKTSGYLFYEVPVDSESIEVRYSFNLKLIDNLVVSDYTYPLETKFIVK